MSEDEKQKITCLCLESFSEGDRPYLHMTPPMVVDAEGRTVPTSMVCCNSCWLEKLSLFQQAVLSLATTPAEQGGFLVGPLIAERFWPEFLQPVKNTSQT